MDQPQQQQALLVERRRKGVVWVRVVVAGLSAALFVLTSSKKTPMSQLYAKPFQDENPRDWTLEEADLRSKYPYQVWGGNLTTAVSLCSEFDDDASFPDEHCDCGDARTQCAKDMVELPRYHDLCFEAACGAENMESYHSYPSDDMIEKCAGLARPAWGVPCAWQAATRLPETCAGTFAPREPFGRARDVPNRYPDLSSLERYKLGYTSSFAGPCNAHAFCFSCLDGAYDLGVNPYCRAVFAAYGATPESPKPLEDIDGHHVVRSFFGDLDSYWCRPEILRQLAAFEREMRVDGSTTTTTTSTSS